MAAFALVDVFEDCHSFFWLDTALEDPSDAALHKLSVIIVYAAARRCTSLAEISSAGSSLLTRNLRMGWAHEGAVTSSAVNVATMTRVGGLGGVELELATASCVVAVLGPTAAVPGPGSEVPGPGSEVPEPSVTTAVPGTPVEVPEPPAGFPKSDPTASGSGGTKMESDSGDGLTDGLRRRWRETPVGIACRVEPIRARASAFSLSARGTWRNSHPLKYPLIC